MTDRCISIDWLEVYALEDSKRYPCNADYFRKQGIWVNEREYGTRVWREMFTVCDNYGQPLMEIRRNPASNTLVDKGLFPVEACHLRLPNIVCYSKDPVNILRSFMAQHGYTLKKIFRIDIALDFEKFDRGDDPAKFIERYMRGVYAKINQANISAHGTDQWNGRIWNSLSWGKPKSMVGTKMYCKTLELMQTVDKPYIKMKWFDSHLIDDPISMTKRGKDGQLYKPDIWRVEFSIKASASKWFLIESSTQRHKRIPMPHTLDMYDSDTKLLTMFSSLAQHYFHFKYYEKEQRKDRCKDKILFDFSPLDHFYQIDRMGSDDKHSTKEQRLLNLLRNFAEVHPNPEVYKAVETICDYIERNLLKDMLSTHYNMADVQALQLLISQRMAGIKSPDVIQQLNEIKDIIKESPDLF